MSVLDSAKDYIKNEMAYDINLKGEKKKKKKEKKSAKIYIQNERPFIQKKKSEVEK